MERRKEPIGSVLFFLPFTLMADNSNPAAGTPDAPQAPASNSAPTGTGTGAAPAAPSPAPAAFDAHGVPTDPVARAAHFEKNWKEATGQNTPLQQQNARYRELYGDLEGAPTAPPAPHSPAPVDPAQKPWTHADQQDWNLSQQIARTPPLVPHQDEIKKLVGGGLQIEEAREIVAKRHNIALSPTMHSDIELMPTTPSGGGAPAPGGQGLSPEHEQSLRSEGKDPEKAKKHMPAIARAWAKAK